MIPEPQLLARGSWSPDSVHVHWREDEWDASPELERAADAAVAALRDRDSPAHDGLAARVDGWQASPERLDLELQPARWALRLVQASEARSLAAMCVVRSADGRWLAGRRAAWLATWAGRWTLGAGGAVEVGENPADTLARELQEEWQLVPAELTVEALVAMPSGLVALVGLATLDESAEPVPDAEHDAFAWWPADVSRWPPEAGPEVRRMAGALEPTRAGRRTS